MTDTTETADEIRRLTDALEEMTRSRDQAQAEAFQYRTALQGVARRAASAAVVPAADRAAPELTAEEARALAEDLGYQLYRAQDALAFVGECCDIADRERRPVTTADVREWLKGARCGRQLVAEAADRAALRDRIAEALIRWTYRGQDPDPETGILDTVRANAYSRADAVLSVLPAPADRTAVLLKAVRRIEDSEPLPDRDLRFGRGADWVLSVLRRMAAEAAVPAVGVAADTTPVGECPRCPDCGLPHDLTPGMALACASIRASIAAAEPGPVVPAQPGNDTKTPGADA